MLQTLLIILGVMVAILLIFIIVIFIVIVDLKLIVLYKLSPKKFKYRCVRKMKKDETELFILGTLHWMHLTNKDYSMLDIKAFIENYQPDLLLVESRPEEIERDNLGDGPPEMLYSHLIGKELGIEVRGIDWFTSEDGDAGTTYKKRDEHITENIVKEAKGYKKVLVIMGASHMLIDTKKLKKEKFKLKRVSKNEKVNLFKHEETPLIHPRQTKHYIEKRIHVEQINLASENMNEQWRNATKRLIKDLTKYLDMINEEE